jgi:hypothetical protein
MARRRRMHGLPVRVMPTSHAFLRTAAVCWMITSVTTLGLIFLPRLLPPAPDLLSQARIAAEPIRQLRLWVGVVHPMIALVGALGVGCVTWRRAPGATAVAIVCMLAWSLGEALQQALLLVGQSWRLFPRYLAADDASRVPVAAAIEAVAAASDALFFLLLLAFIAGNVLFAWATRAPRGLQLAVSIAFVLAAALGVVSFVTRFGGGLLPGGAMDVLYPAIQPAGRFMVGVWLWRVRR